MPAALPTAILEGKAQSLNEVVQTIGGEDEFVEVEEEAAE